MKGLSLRKRNEEPFGFTNDNLDKDLVKEEELTKYYKIAAKIPGVDMEEYADTQINWRKQF